MFDGNGIVDKKFCSMQNDQSTKSLVHYKEAEFYFAL
jgi:hypothetical protein